MARQKGKISKKGRKFGQARKRRKVRKLDKQIVILLIILAGLLIGFFLGNYLLRKPYFDYKGFRVYRVGLEGAEETIIFYSIPVSFKIGFEVQQRNVVLRNDPREIEKMNISIEVSDYFLKTRPLELWITKRPDLKAKVIEAAHEITKFVGNLNIPVTSAYTYTIENRTVNIAKCEDASNEDRVILLELGERTVVYTSDNPSCIVVEADSYDNLIKAADALVIEWLLRVQEKA